MRKIGIFIGLLLALTSYGQVGSAPYAISYHDAAWLTNQRFPVATYDWQSE